MQEMRPNSIVGITFSVKPEIVLLLLLNIYYLTLCEIFKCVAYLKNNKVTEMRVLNGGQEKAIAFPRIFRFY